MKNIIIARNILLSMMFLLTASASVPTKAAQKTEAQPAKAEMKKTSGSAQPAPPSAQPPLAKSSTGINFCECTWATAVSKAKLEKKAIFVDAYASWCGPCKYLKRNIFTMPEVGDFYNKNFVNMAIDWEKNEARPLYGKYPLRAFPTLMFFNPVTEQVIAVAEGALDGTNMIAFGNYGLAQLDKDNKNSNPAPARETETAPKPAPKASAASVPAKSKDAKTGFE